MVVASVNADGISVNLAFAVQGQKFIAKLTGQNEVPPIATRATGSLEMELSPDGTISHYVLNVTSISIVLSTQIHEGANGKNGPIIVTLSQPYLSLMNGTNINGTLSQGTVHSKLFEGPLTGKYLSDLITLINNGIVYVNISTKQHPLGEIRGQLVPAKADPTSTNNNQTQARFVPRVDLIHPGRSQGLSKLRIWS